MSSRFWLVVAFVVAFGASPANPCAALGGDNGGPALRTGANAGLR
jgi:hypothetical protein